MWPPLFPNFQAMIFVVLPCVKLLLDHGYTTLLSFVLNATFKSNLFCKTPGFAPEIPLKARAFLALQEAQERAYQHIQRLLLVAGISHPFLENPNDDQVDRQDNISLHCFC